MVSCLLFLVTIYVGLTSAIGCVRLWDPQSSLEDPHNGGVIGEIDSDVARFSLGDWTEKEHPLIVCVLNSFFVALGLTCCAPQRRLEWERFDLRQAALFL